ncbi:MAG: threonine--tRNA ligase [Patescibacteria group bacterium]
MSKENKEDNLNNLRHSLAHLLAAAVLDIYPKALPTIGPAIENGFYYDFDNLEISDKDLPKIEQKMREILKSWKEFSHKEVSAAEANKIYKGNPYKLELISEIDSKGEKITLYTAGDFTDLCRGGHLENPSKEIKSDAFKLDRIAGAYWRGNEKNKMLNRIYGLAFKTKDELKSYETGQEEAKKRDHRKLGKDLDLFTISELVGGGLPLFTPKGTVLREMLASYSQELQAMYGFERVWTPHMARTELYKHSGHFDKYPERFEVTSAESTDVFMLKPMNCPHHAQLFARKPWSYRELPVRYMENTTNYRDEKHGELHGLSRVRSLSQDDGHIFCQETHIEEEFRNIIRMVKKLYKALGLQFYVRLSFRDDSDKFLGDANIWKRAESMIAKVAADEKLETVIGLGEAAFYGPKLDFLVKDALGREWQCATIQLDFVQPERFGLSYTDSDGKEKRPVMIHKALLGSIERFISVYIEHTNGNFPLWLSPVQIKVIPIRENHNAFAKEISDALKNNGVRVKLDDSDEGLGKKVRAAKVDKIPYWLVIGDKEMAEGKVTLESRDKGKIGEFTLESLKQLLKKEIDEKI